MWREQIAALSDRYRCIAFDCRGHGGSSYNARFTVAGVAADLKAGLEALGVETCHLVGMAMGGPIAISFAAQWPEAVRSVTVADGFVDMREVGGARIPEWARTIRSTPMTEFGRRYAEMRLTPSASDEARKELAAAIAKVPPEAYIDVMKAIFDGIEFTGEAAAVRAPSLVIWGEEDEAREARDHLYRLAVGLVRRCRTAIHLGLCDVNEQGSEYRGRFLRAIDEVLRSAQGRVDAPRIEHERADAGKPIPA